MKKIFALTAALAVCLTVTSCGDKNSLPEDTSAIEQYIEQASETTQEEATTTVTTEKTTAENITTEETTVTEQEYMRDEKQLLAFLDYLQNGSYYPFEFGNPIDVYDFMDNFKIDSYSYGHRGDGVYDVKLTCSESTCDMFPNGDSYWVYSFNFDTLFIPAEREEEFDVVTHAYYNSILDFSFDEKSKVYAAYCAAVDFSLVTDVFEADKEWFESYIETNTHGFYHAYQQDIITENINEKGELIQEGVPIDEFVKSVKKLYNVTISPDIYESMDTVYCAGHGGSWLYDNFAGYDETEDEVKVRVDYYGDELYLFVAVQSEYTFSKNADGTITLQKVEKIFDRGYEPARGTI